jgi:hypothetical protein
MTAEFHNITQLLLEVLFQQRDEIDKAIIALGGTPPSRVTMHREVAIQPGAYSGIKPVHALEKLLTSAGCPMSYDEALALLAKGGLKTDKRILAIGVAQGGNGSTGKRFYVDAEGKICLSARR